jgi:hypothetical protein
MLRTISTERVNGIVVCWTAGLSEAARDSVRVWVERYPDLLPPCKKLVVGWDFRGSGQPSITSLSPIERADREEALLLDESSWYKATEEQREFDFVAGALVAALRRDGKLVADDEGGLVLNVGRERLRGRDVECLISAMVEDIVKIRGQDE